MMLGQVLMKGMRKVPARLIILTIEQGAEISKRFHRCYFLLMGL